MTDSFGSRAHITVRATPAKHVIGGGTGYLQPGRRGRAAEHPKRANPSELEEINLAARSSGNDAILDTRLLDTETACRRSGALGRLLVDLDIERGLVRLRGKGGTHAGSRRVSRAG